MVDAPLDLTAPGPTAPGQTALDHTALGHTALELWAEDLLLTAPQANGSRQTILMVPALNAAPGERLAVTGPSGSGKTSLLHVLAGIERPDRGRVRWGDTELGALGESARDRWRRRTVGLVFQDFHLFAGMSVLDNVLLPARFERWSVGGALLARARGLLERVGLGHPDQPVETLSRGEMQRVAVARALLFRPRILLADEPTASLDVAAGAVVAALLLDLAAEAGATLIVVSHDAGLVARLDRAVHLTAGHLAEPGADAPVRSSAA